MRVSALHMLSFGASSRLGTTHFSRHPTRSRRAHRGVPRPVGLDPAQHRQHGVSIRTAVDPEEIRALDLGLEIV
eukprot:4018580-Pleurochrysis_carterae.AAC.3